MANNNTSKQNELLDLVYPVYLNVPMLTSFIAAIENGIATEEERSTSNKSSTEKNKSFEGGASIGKVFSGLLGIDMKGQISNKAIIGDDETVKVLRKHTEASLFMRFRDTLNQNNLIHSVDYLQDEQIELIQKGSFIEIAGKLERSFIKEAFDSIDQMIEFISEMPDESTNLVNSSQSIAHNKSRGRGQQPSSRNAIAKPTSTLGETIKNLPNWNIYEIIKRDISKPMIQDLTLVSIAQYKGNPLKVIIPFQKSEFTDINFESVRYSEIRLLGKVISKDLEGNSEINLLRRAVTGNMPQQNLNDILKDINAMMKQINPKNVELSSPFVQPPWLEVLPIALFV